jgi:hypothetical protein
MVFQGQERHLFVAPLHRNWQSAFPSLTGKSSCSFSFHSKHHCSYPDARLLEINSHSFFSKWFSESGKLVQRLFNGITDLIEEEEGFVVVLIGILRPIVISLCIY